MPNSRFGYSVKKNSFKGLNIDCIQYSNIIRITHYSYSYSGTILNPNIIRIRIRPNICAQILFVFVFAHSEETNNIRIRIRSKFWFRIIFVFVFGPKNSIRSPLRGLYLARHIFNYLMAVDRWVGGVVGSWYCSWCLVVGSWYQLGMRRRRFYLARSSPTSDFLTHHHPSASLYFPNAETKMVTLQQYTEYRQSCQKLVKAIGT